MRRRSSIVTAALFALVAGAGLVAVATPAVAAGTHYTWVGADSDSSWGDAGNWSPNGVPGDGDSVSLVPDSADNCPSIDDAPTVTLADLSFAEYGTIGTPTGCYAKLAGGAITVTGSFAWKGGTIETPLTLSAGATGTITSTHSDLSTLDADLDLGGTLTLHGASADDALKIDYPHVLHVKATGNLVSSGSNDVTFSECCGDPAKIVNDGAVTVDGGTLNVNAVEFDQHGVLTGKNGGTLVTTQAPTTASDGATYTGDGTWSIQSDSGNVLTGTQTLGPAFHLRFGGIDGGSLADLDGTFSLAGTGTFDWNGGEITADLTLGHGITTRVSGAQKGNAHRLLSSDPDNTLTNHGTIVVSNGAGFTENSRGW